MSAIVKELLRDYHSIDDSSKFDLGVAIETLVANDELNEEERIILKLTINQIHCSEISKIVSLKKSAINVRINKIAKKISNCLDADYQDEKIVKEAESRLGRKLTTDEERFCWKAIRAGRPIKKGINIFNFRNGNYDTERGKNKAEG